MSSTFRIEVISNLEVARTIDQNRFSRSTRSPIRAFFWRNNPLGGQTQSNQNISFRRLDRDSVLRRMAKFLCLLGSRGIAVARIWQSNWQCRYLSSGLGNSFSAVRKLHALGTLPLGCMDKATNLLRDHESESAIGPAGSLIQDLVSISERTLDDRARGYHHRNSMAGP